MSGCQDFQRNIALARPGGLGGATRSFDSLATIPDPDTRQKGVCFFAADATFPALK